MEVYVAFYKYFVPFLEDISHFTEMFHVEHFA